MEPAKDREYWIIAPYEKYLSSLKFLNLIFFFFCLELWGKTNVMIFGAHLALVRLYLWIEFFLQILPSQLAESAQVDM
jgi:hypothetical protein